MPACQVGRREFESRQSLERKIVVKNKGGKDMSRVYNYLCRKMIEASNQANISAGAVIGILVVLGVLAYFTVTSPQFHGIGHG
jgi:hypothetical protein